MLIFIQTCFCFKDFFHKQHLINSFKSENNLNTFIHFEYTWVLYSVSQIHFKMFNSTFYKQQLLCFFRSKFICVVKTCIALNQLLLIISGVIIVHYLKSYIKVMSEVLQNQKYFWGKILLFSMVLYYFSCF